MTRETTTVSRHLECEGPCVSWPETAAYDISAAKQDLGYQPSVSFEQGLSLMRADRDEGTNGAAASVAATHS